jgi:PPOX class probable F420-dependent enzyme
MDEAQRDQFISAPHTAVLATVDAAGRAHAVPVWYRWQDGAFRVITGRGSAKHRNILRTGRATLCIDERGPAFRHVTAECRAEDAGPCTVEERLALHTHYRGAEAAQKVVAGGGHEGMVTLVLHPERWY